MLVGWRSGQTDPPHGWGQVKCDVMIATGALEKAEAPGGRGGMKVEEDKAGRWSHTDPVLPDPHWTGV